MAFRNKSGDFYNRPEKLGLKKILWNPETKKFLRRTAGSWAKIITFYLIFYAVLLGFCMTLWSVFELTLPEGRPKYTDINGNVKTPGLVTRRMSKNDNSEYEFIRYNKNYGKFYIDETNIFVEEHLPRGSKIVDCKNSSSCDENSSAFGSCTAHNDFGYPEGKPCIFLKLNKVFDWQPEFYKDELPENMPELLKTHIKNSIKSGENLDVVWVSCEGENPADVENLGSNVEYKSLGGEQGFNGNYFPYENTDGYLQPLVAVQFQSVKPGVLINIECKAWAKNIIHDRKDRKGMFRFKLMIDDF